MTINNICRSFLFCFVLIVIFYCFNPSRINRFFLPPYNTQGHVHERKREPSFRRRWNNDASRPSRHAGVDSRPWRGRVLYGGRLRPNWSTTFSQEVRSGVAMIFPVEGVLGFLWGHKLSFVHLFHKNDSWFLWGALGIRYGGTCPPPPPPCACRGPGP